MLRDGDRSELFLKFYRDLYNANIRVLNRSDTPLIPKIIHQIWIGTKPFPALYEQYASTCKATSPGFDYRLWTNKDIKDILAINPQYQSLYQEYEKHGHITGQKDILEFLILYKYGGIFLDADIKCEKSLDPLVYNYDFFSALEPANRWSKIPIMTNAVVGSKKGNQIFIDTLDMAVNKYSKMYQKDNSWYKKLGRKIANIGKSKAKTIRIPDQRIVLMLSLGENLVEKNSIYNRRAIVFPATYFNPVMPQVDYDFKDYIKYLIGIYSNKGKTFKEIKPETIAVQDFFD